MPHLCNGCATAGRVVAVTVPDNHTRLMTANRQGTTSNFMEDKMVGLSTTAMQNTLPCVSWRSAVSDVVDGRSALALVVVADFFF